MHCRNCGTEVDFYTVNCPKCGAPQRSTEPVVEDKGGFGLTILGFCIPLAGLILYLVWKDTKPKSATDAGLGALIHVGLIVSYYLFAFMLGAMR